MNRISTFLCGVCYFSLLFLLAPQDSVSLFYFYFFDKKYAAFSHIWVQSNLGFDSFFFLSFWLITLIRVWWTPT